MKISNRWFESDDAWDFHIANKNIWRRIIDGASIETLIDLKLKREWLTDEGEGHPPNYLLIEKAVSDYFAFLESEKIKVPEPENRLIDKVAGFVKGIYRQDSAYFERIGGVITVLIVAEPQWVGKTRTERLKVLEKTEKWFVENDKRKRTINWMKFFFDYAIKKYKTNEFYEKSINFFVDWFIANKNEWVIVGVYDPKMWYPAGRGQINAKIHGNES